jgi:hypothetical protein
MRTSGGSLKRRDSWAFFGHCHMLIKKVASCSDYLQSSLVVADRGEVEETVLELVEAMRAALRA